jgi:hypothetical protein
MKYRSNFLRTLFFVLGFMPLSYSFADNKIIQSIHFSEVGAQTRVTFGLNEAFPLELEEDAASNKITIKGPENGAWHLSPHEKTLGFVKKYQVTGSTLSLEVVPGTDIDDYGLQKNKAGESEFFVDLKNQEKQQAHQEVKEEKKSSLFPARPRVEKEDIPQALHKVSIQKEGSETILTLETSTPITLDPDLQQAKKKLVIALPKTNWLYVDTKEKQGGVIQGYHVDESSPHVSKLIFSLKSPVDMTIHPLAENGGYHQYRISFKASVDANAALTQEEGMSLKKKRGKVQTTLPTKLPSKPQVVRKKLSIKELPKPESKTEFELEYKPEPKMESEVEPKKEEVSVPEKEPPVEQPVEHPSEHQVERQVEHQIEHQIKHKIDGNVPEQTQEPIPEAAPELPQGPAAFTIEGEEESLHAEELREDLKGLQISLSLPEEMAYVPKEDLQKDNLKEEPPKVLKKFKISPTQDVASIASQQTTPQHLPLSNAGTMFTRLQSTQEAQASNEGTAPAWVIEAKMHEQKA